MITNTGVLFCFCFLIELFRPPAPPSSVPPLPPLPASSLLYSCCCFLWIQGHLGVKLDLKPLSLQLQKTWKSHPSYIHILMLACRNVQSQLASHSAGGWTQGFMHMCVLAKHCPKGAPSSTPKLCFNFKQLMRKHWETFSSFTFRILSRIFGKVKPPFT